MSTCDIQGHHWEALVPKRTSFRLLDCQVAEPNASSSHNTDQPVLTRNFRSLNNPLWLDTDDMDTPPPRTDPVVFELKEQVAKLVAWKAQMDETVQARQTSIGRNFSPSAEGFFNGKAGDTADPRCIQSSLVEQMADMQKQMHVLEQQLQQQQASEQQLRWQLLSLQAKAGPPSTRHDVPSQEQVNEGQNSLPGTGIANKKSSGSVHLSCGSMDNVARTQMSCLPEDTVQLRVLINGMNDSLSRRIGALEVLAPASNTLHLTRPTSFRNAKEGNAAPEAVLEAVLNEVGPGLAAALEEAEMANERSCTMQEELTGLLNQVEDLSSGVIIATEKINRRLVKLEGLQGLQHLPSNPDSKASSIVQGVMRMALEPARTLQEQYNIDSDRFGSFQREREGSRPSFSGSTHVTSKPSRVSQQEQEYSEHQHHHHYQQQQPRLSSNLAGRPYNDVVNQAREERLHAQAAKANPAEDRSSPSAMEIRAKLEKMVFGQSKAAPSAADTRPGGGERSNVLRKKL